jgi:cobalt-zinc-cadmium efflux system protein
VNRACLLVKCQARGVFLGFHHHHDHNHDHHHGREQTSKRNYNWIFFIGIGLNLGFVIVEYAAGFWAQSLALMSDASHNLSDVASLFLAWGALWLARSRPNPKYTFGLKRASILAALVNSLALSAVIGVLMWEAFGRFWQPAAVQADLMILVAALGVLINAATAVMLMQNKSKDINIQSAFLHMVADALISLGVVVSGIVIKFTDWVWLDPLSSLLVCAFILAGSWSLLKQALKLSMDAVPAHIDALAVKKALTQVSGVVSVHDLHIWSMSSSEVAMTAHLVVPHLKDSNDLLSLVQKQMQQFHIHHVTVQFEVGEQFACPLKSDGLSDDLAPAQ